MMMTVATSRALKEWLADRLAEHGWTVVELAKRINSSPSAISMWLSGAQFPGAANTFALARVFSVDPQWLADRIAEEKAQRKGLTSIAEPRGPYGRPALVSPADTFDAFRQQLADMVIVPVGDIAAGPGALTDMTFYLPRALVGARRVVGYRVQGDSMEPEVPNGSFVAVDLDRPAKAGDIVVAWTSQGGIVKRLRRGKGQLELVGNDASVIAVDEEVHIEGVVFSVTSFLL